MTPCYVYDGRVSNVGRGVATGIWEFVLWHGNRRQGARLLASKPTKHPMKRVIPQLSFTSVAKIDADVSSFVCVAAWLVGLRRRLGRVIWIVVPCVFFGLIVPQHSSAELRISAACKYYFVTLGREIISYCGERLDAGTERRYLALRSILRRHMKAGGVKFEKEFGPKFEEDLRREITEKDSLRQICKVRSAYDEAKQMFGSFISQKGLDQAVEKMNSEINPKEGDCF